MRKPRQRNSTRDREKAELAALRSLASELQAHLTALSCGEIPLSPHRSVHGSKSAWERLCERQARARQEAECVNRELNDRVQSNADWIQRLWELLSEKRRATEVSGFQKLAALQWKVEDGQVLGQLKQQAQAALLDLPTVFSSHGVQVFGESQDSDGGFESDVWTHKRTGDLSSALVCIRRVPFDVHSTSSAVWTALTRPDGCFTPDCSLGAASHCQDSKVRIMERTPSVCAMRVRDTILLNEVEVVDYHAVVLQGPSPTPLSNNVVVWKSSFTLANGSLRYEDTLSAAILRYPGSVESVIVIVCQAQLEMRVGYNLQNSVMTAVDSCIKTILSNAENLLLSESSPSSASETLASIAV